jgi:hypothetical protein
MEQPLSSVSIDDTFEALGHVQRRRLLTTLLESTDKDETIVRDADSDGMDTLVMMKHVHFPKLAAYGFIQWNKETDEVEQGPAFAEIRPLLELLVTHENELPDGFV